MTLPLLQQLFYEWELTIIECELAIRGTVRKEKVYADRRVWEASDRPWRPFLFPMMLEVTITVSPQSQ